MPYCAYCGTQVAQVSYAPCPSCGKPTNGAPQATVKGGTNTAVIIAVVLVAVLVIVAIVGILAAIAIPNLLTAMQRSKQKRSMADIRTIATAAQAYATDHNFYPQPASLERELVPKYLQALPKNDGWEHPYRYECWSSTDGACDSYAIGSAGKDGSFDHPSLRDYESGTITTFDGDIVFSNSGFVRYPEGMQH